MLGVLTTARIASLFEYGCPNEDLLLPLLHRTCSQPRAARRHSDGEDVNTTAHQCDKLLERNTLLAPHWCPHPTHLALSTKFDKLQTRQTVLFPDQLRQIHLFFFIGLSPSELLTAISHNRLLDTPDNLKSAKQARPRAGPSHLNREDLTNKSRLMSSGLKTLHTFHPVGRHHAKHHHRDDERNQIRPRRHPASPSRK